MTSIEIPIGKRTKLYRFFEILPAFLSYGSIALLLVLSILKPFVAAIYLLLVITTIFIKSVAVAIRTIQGYNRLQSAQKVNWQDRLNDMNYLQQDGGLLDRYDNQWCNTKHKQLLDEMKHLPADYPKVSSIYNAVIIATYNETIETLRPTIHAVINTTFPNEKIILVIAYEERGGEAIKNTVEILKKEFSDKFFHFQLVMHPKDLPNEVPGKGGNITYAGKYLAKWVEEKGIHEDDVIITTLDSDNRPHKEYFSYVTYEYVRNPYRLHLSFQPISLFLNNIWDAPAPMRVIATGNSFWNIISSMRPHMLRNFASHSQGLAALKGMDFWSVRTIVEDGHQFWRSFFFFEGKYRVIPIYVPIYQDAVLSKTYRHTIVAQFKQVRRWAYGASDIPYVAVRIFNKHRRVPFWNGLTYFIRLLDSHVSWACIPLLVAFGGWLPLLLNQDSSRNIVVHELPEFISIIQRIAMFGILVSVFLAFKMLPKRPKRYKRHRNVFMVIQWFLMPLTSIIFGALAAFNAQTHLALGKYLDTFDVTDKSVKK